MKEDIKVTGLILLAAPVSEYDKRLVILTKERGKITVFARGARRPGSSFLAAANPFAFGEFELFRGRSAFNLQRAHISQYFRDLTTDYDKACYGFYFLEAAEYYSMENEDDKELLKLLYQSLRALESDKFSLKLVRSIFELKLLKINGEYPDLYSCIGCGSKENLKALHIRKGGCVCEKCFPELGGREISGSALYAMQFVISSPVAKLFTFRLTPEVEKEFFDAVEALRAVYMPHPFKSLEVLI